MRVLGPTVLVAIALALVPSASLASRACGNVTTAGTRYHVRVANGVVSCTTAKTVMKTFLQRGRNAKGWTCQMGQGTKWFAQCKAPKKLVRAYFAGPGR
jgi:hypothetical protein